jgi:hypothetical protein
MGFKIADISIAINDTLHIDVKETMGNMPKPVIELFPGDDGILKLHISQKFNPLKLDSVLNYIDSVFTHTIAFPNISEFYSEGEIKFGFGLGLFSKNKMLVGKILNKITILFYSFQNLRNGLQSKQKKNPQTCGLLFNLSSF